MRITEGQSLDELMEATTELLNISTTEAEAFWKEIVKRGWLLVKPIYEEKPKSYSIKEASKARNRR